VGEKHSRGWRQRRSISETPEQGFTTERTKSLERLTTNEERKNTFRARPPPHQRTTPYYAGKKKPRRKGSGPFWKTIEKANTALKKKNNGREK